MCGEPSGSQLSHKPSQELNKSHLMAEQANELTTRKVNLNEANPNNGNDNRYGLYQSNDNYGQ